MESLAQMLGGANMRTVTNNVAMPLACEWLGARDAPQDAGLLGNDATGPWSLCVDGFPRGTASSYYVSPAVAAAAAEALGGFSSPPEGAAAAAARALTLSPLAADAYSLRALRCAGSLEEALELYRTAERAAREALKPGAMDELAPRGRGGGGAAAWDILELRPLVRAMHGALLRRAVAARVCARCSRARAPHVRACARDAHGC
jgi:hypothetical protein